MRASILLAAGGVALLSAIAPAAAQDNDQAVAEALACDAVRGTKARLKCFEAALPALRNAYPGAVALAAERAEAARQAAAQEAKDDFGLAANQIASSEAFERDAFGDSDLAKFRADDEEDEVESVGGVAVEVGKNNRGKLFVILDNGQVWRQVSGDSSSPYYPKNVDGLPVTIKKGAIGSYFVKIGKAKDAFRAERIK